MRMEILDEARLDLVYGFRFYLLAKRFPLAIYYYVEGNVARVQGVLDSRRHPERIRKRLT